MAKENKFTGLFEFGLSHLEVLIASITIEVDAEITGPERVVGLDDQMRYPFPVVDHHGLVVLEVLSV